MLCGVTLWEKEYLDTNISTVREVFNMKKLRKELNDALYFQHKNGVGVKKHEIKNEHNSSQYIHSDATYRTYKQQVNHFVDFMQANGYRYMPSPSDFKNMTTAYIEKLKSEGKSAWTIQTALCAIAKAVNLKTTDFNIDLPKKERAAVKRSRYEVEQDKHVSKAHNDALINFCKCTGLRRREVEKVSTKDFHEKNGFLFVFVKNGKGGKPRDIRVFGSSVEINKIKKLIADKEGRVFEKVPKNIDIHSYRAIYAARVYKHFERENIPREDKYFCRKDKAGIVYDRHAMELASFSLGHNRIDVIATSYLHTL